MNHWLRQHGLCFTGAIARLARTPLASLLNIGVIGVALALPLAFYLVLVNAQSLLREKSPVPQVSLFLALDAQTTDTRDIENRLKKHVGIAKVRFISRDQALADLKAKSGLADVIGALGGNPLQIGRAHV